MRLQTIFLTGAAACILAAPAYGQDCIEYDTVPLEVVLGQAFQVPIFGTVTHHVVVSRNGFITDYSYKKGSEDLVSKTVDGVPDGNLDAFDANVLIISGCNGLPFSTFSAHAIAHAASAQAPAGQAHQWVTVGDFNGDGVPDSASVTPSGVLVTLNKADGSTLSTASYSVPNAAQSILTADFNRDGHLDLAFTEDDASGQGNVIVMLGKGDGTFGAATKFPVSQLYAFYLETADFNGDGIPDLAVTNEPNTAAGGGTVSVLPGKGDGTFGAAVNYTVGPYPGTIVAADFNGDGKPDLAALDNATGIVSKVWVLLGRGDGTFQPAVSTATGTIWGNLAYADLNHDGKLDLIIADQYTSAMSVMTGNGDGTFQAATQYVVAAQPVSIAPLPLGDGSTALLTTDNASSNEFTMFVTSAGVVVSPHLHSLGRSPYAIAAADLNGDHHPDLVISDPAGGKIYVVLTPTSGPYPNPVTYSLGSQPAALAIADLNRDGKPDVIAADQTGIDVLLGNGDGTLGAVRTVAAGGSLNSVTIADFNSDGKPDVAAANATAGGVSLFLGNGDGSFQNGRTVSLASGSVPLSAVSGDFNSDGKPDLVVVFRPTDLTQAGGIAVFLGKGDGTFQAPIITALPGPLLPSSSSAPTALSVGDLNGDGKPDVVTAIGLSPPSQIVVLLGKGDGTFQAPILTQTNTAPPQIVIVDRNGDGKQDLLLADCCLLSEASFFAGNGDGTFQPELQFPSGPSPVGIATPDLDGDGRPDLAIIGQVQGNGSAAPFGMFSVSLNLNLTSATGPAPITSTPSFGSASSQNFTFTFSDSSGYQNLSVVDVLINNALDGRHACYVAVVLSGANSGSVFLIDDAGDAGGPYQGLVLPGSGSISNGQCTINGTGSGVNGSGNNLTLTLSITFSAGFSGNKVVYTSAGNKSSANSGWQALGTWNVPGGTPAGPWVSGMNPARTSALGPATYTFTFTDSNGWPDISVANILINTAIDGRHGCYLAIVPAAQQVLLVDDAGDAGGPYSGMVLPGNGTVSNSQCSITGAGSSIAGSGNTLTVTLAMTFSPSFAGNQLFFLAARSNTANSNWQAVGTVSVP
ncbi:MAG TPA: VCBS repeat-containing protein [Bryobacteraceae bacterium]|nr:VCBS repeat-containing protein [Bryobacteraceae bacterium]